MAPQFSITFPTSTQTQVSLPSTATLSSSSGFPSGDSSGGRGADNQTLGLGKNAQLLGWIAVALLVAAIVLLVISRGIYIRFFWSRRHPGVPRPTFLAFSLDPPRFRVPFTNIHIGREPSPSPQVRRRRRRRRRQVTGEEVEEGGRRRGTRDEDDYIGEEGEDELPKYEKIDRALPLYTLNSSEGEGGDLGAGMVELERDEVAEYERRGREASQQEQNQGGREGELRNVEGSVTVSHTAEANSG